MDESKVNKLVEKEQFYHLFQPIYNLSTQDRFGFEALFRTNLFDNPELAFQAARDENRLYDLELKSVQKAITTFTQSNSEKKFGKLFVNVFPSTIIHSSFLNFMNKLLLETKVKKDQIVFEINEAEVINDATSLRAKLKDLKKEGFLIAIDDVGKGAASLVSIIELNPDIIKMDLYFSKDLSISEPKQEMIKSILTYCRNTKMDLILEGIEEQKGLEIAKLLEVPNAQGYFLGRPGPLPNFTE